jgi:hypothetical protein
VAAVARGEAVPERDEPRMQREREERAVVRPHAGLAAAARLEVEHRDLLGPQAMLRDVRAKAERRTVRRAGEHDVDGEVAGWPAVERRRDRQRGRGGARVRARSGRRASERGVREQGGRDDAADRRDELDRAEQRGALGAGDAGDRASRDRDEGERQQRQRVRDAAA